MEKAKVETEYSITLGQFFSQYGALVNDEHEAIKHSHPDILEQDEARLNHLRKEFPDHYASYVAFFENEILEH